jgi:coenzyme F420-reducing hydrogenase beta subunit
MKENSLNNVKSIMNCTGCGACVAVCPLNCISIVKNQIDDPVVEIGAGCVECGKCMKICPENRKDLSNNVLRAYVGYSDESLKESSRHASGGIAGAIYNHMLEGKKFIGCGAAWNRDSTEVKICCTKYDKDIYRFYNSKYTYSSLYDAYEEIRNNLKYKKIVLIAMPCQIAAVKSVFEKEYRNGELFLVDIVCHGMPNNELFHQYLNKIVCGQIVEDVYFRKNGKYILQIFSNDGILYSSEYKEDMYFMSYLNNIIFRECCYSCKYSCEQRVGDITIGDYDGDQIFDENGPEVENKSLILVNTERGQKIVDQLSSDKMLHIFEGTLEAVTKNNAQLFSPSKEGHYRTLYKKLYMVSHDFYKSMKYWWGYYRIKNMIISSKFYKKLYKLRNIGEFR